KGKKEKPERVKKRQQKDRSARSSTQPFTENSVGFRGVGEVWQETAIHLVHESSRFGAAGFFHTGLTRLVGLELELGYNQMKGKAVDPSTNEKTGNSATLDLVPISIGATVRASGPTSELFFGAGPALVAFNDRSPTNAISGVKVGFDARLGVRIHTHFIQPSMRPGARGMRRMDVELMLGRRQHQAFGVGTGLDLSAWRVGAGLVGRL
ncbi:MAG: hypothetical protein VX127_14290, partial [Myxococcota bacterium]|nr:hypothetical protein [Myxococcota bacterium]